MVTMDNLENLYCDLLAIVRREVTNMAEQDELDDKQFRQLTEADKIIRGALEFYGNKKQKNQYESEPTEDLAKDFE